MEGRGKEPRTVDARTTAIRSPTGGRVCDAINDGKIAESSRGSTLRDDLTKTVDAKTSLKRFITVIIL